jgi:AbrB family looped-hinge helix DNA binding protein
MKSTAVVGERGQVTIPKHLRQRLGIRPGTQLRFAEQEGDLVATRTDAEDPLQALIGAGRRRRVDALLAELRGPAYQPERDGGQ